jgi:hypothetical protein
MFILKVLGSVKNFELTASFGKPRNQGTHFLKALATFVLYLPLRVFVLQCTFHFPRAAPVPFLRNLRPFTGRAHGASWDCIPFKSPYPVPGCFTFGRHAKALGCPADDGGRARARFAEGF